MRIMVYCHLCAGSGMTGHLSIGPTIIHVRCLNCRGRGSYPAPKHFHCLDCHSDGHEYVLLRFHKPQRNEVIWRCPRGHEWRERAVVRLALTHIRKRA
jgi:DnaJ-class molecular chaperone